MPAAGHAYRTGGDLPELSESERVRWAEPVVAYELHDDPPNGLTYPAIEDAVASAAQTWNRVDCASAELRLAGRATSPAEPDDGTSTVSWVHDGWEDKGFDPDAAASTDVRYVKESTEWGLVEADLYLNAEHFDWTLGAGSDAERKDVEAVTIHEFGHVLGLLHPCSVDGGPAPACGDEHEGVALHPAYAPTLRALAEDDIAGLCFLYPTEPACDPADCPAGYECSEVGCRPTCAGTGCPCDPELGCARGTCVAGRCDVPAGYIGDPCTSSLDCRTSHCADERGYCTETCTEACPAGYACEESVCLTMDGVYGEACERGKECTTGLCVSGNRFDAMCTRGCDGVPCPAGDQCMLVDGRAVCRPPARDGKQGCSVGGDARSPVGAIGVGLALWAFGRRRRGR